MKRAAEGPRVGPAKKTYQESLMSEISREALLVSRPDGFPTLDNFEIKSITLEAPDPARCKCGTRGCPVSSELRKAVYTL
jgi:hypothetical protein